MTTQTQFNREYNRNKRIIDSALKGQQSIRPNADGYTQTQRSAFEQYQSFIDRATKRLSDLLAARGPLT